jgi:signal transduction histidine kinase
MDNKTEKILSVILYTATIFTFGFSITFNTENKVILGILSSLLIVTISVRYTIVYPSEKYRSIGRFMILFDVALIYWIVLIDKSGVSQLYLLALLADVILNNPSSYSGIVTAVSYFSYIGSVYIRDGYPQLNNFIPYTIFSLSSFLFVFGMIYLTKHQILQHTKLVAALKEIEFKNSELQLAYKKLKETSEALEEVIVLKERNRIAREIHDTIGHTLTTVLVEVEAGKRLISKDAELAQQKLELAQEQVRKGLSDIRQSVRLLKDRGSILEFIPAIDSLIQETENHTGVKISCDISLNAKLSKDLEYVLYNSLLEGITNGIRHGNSSHFLFVLSANSREVNFLLQDNGTGCEKPILGFGLTSMKDRVENCGGIIHMLTSPNNGFKITINIPLKEKLNL